MLSRVSSPLMCNRVWAVRLVACRRAGQSRHWSGHLLGSPACVHKLKATVVAQVTVTFQDKRCQARLPPLAPPPRTKFSFGSCGCCWAGVRNVFQSDSLLLLAKLYLIQWVFPCTVDFPNVINFNVKESCELCCLAPSPGCCVDVFSLFPNSGGLGKLG